MTENIDELVDELDRLSEARDQLTAEHKSLSKALDVQIVALRNQYTSERDHHQSSFDTWYRAWMLSLAVGNGGGLLTLGAALINGWKLGIWIAIVPSLWIFALGLSCAGVAPLLRSHYHRALKVGSTTGLAWIDTPESREKLERDLTELTETATILQDWSAKVAAAAAACFGAGLLWPIGVVTLWLFKLLPVAVSWPFPAR
jgi:hypothetical protein